MAFEVIILELAIIFAGVAVLATIFIYARQPIILSYIALGMIVGPYAVGLIERVDHIEHISHIGIVLLLFLVGLHLHPSKLINLFKKTAIVTGITSMVFAVLFAAVAFAYRLSIVESLIVGAALMFSSTIVGLKLMPGKTLHQQRLGEIMVSVLLLQDIIAVVVILLLEGSGKTDLHFHIPLLIVKGIGLTAAAILIVKYGILRLFKKFEDVQEYMLVLTLGWCLAVAAGSKALGMSYEIGAFIAGCSLAVSPAALVVSKKLKPLREFFLILFFFSIGTQFDFLLLKDVLRPSIVLALMILVIKPYAFFKAFGKLSEPGDAARELGFRLGQASEFSLLVAYMAVESAVISNRASYVIQLTVIITFIISTYLVSYSYETPGESFKPLSNK